jgi:predicted NACHT family NTPase
MEIVLIFEKHLDFVKNLAQKTVRLPFFELEVQFVPLKVRSYDCLTMPRNSLKACKAGISKAKIALTGKNWTQAKLALRAKITRQPVVNFFAGRGVAKENFLEICKLLDLDWREIVDIDKNLTNSVTVLEEANASIDTLVEEVRKKIKPYIQERCSSIRLLDMNQPIKLDNIYTYVNIFEKITGLRRVEIADLLNNFDPEKFDRLRLSGVTEERVPGLQAVQQYSKLIVFGKPGAGKTTFLKYLAIQCMDDHVQKNRFPVFIILKDFAEKPEQPSILEYITHQLSICKLIDASIKVEQLLEQGRVLILLDGLDEVGEKDTKRVLKQIQDFSNQFHTNHFVITCRIAAKEYTFEKFTEVEIADFNEDQIATFTQNWFQLSDPVKGERFIQKRKENKPILELATNPILLTLFCLVFGETGKFPANRSKIYTEGINILLKKWDVNRNIERNQVYKNLSLQRKKDLLSYIALTTFEQNHYFFKQKTVQGYITDFISDLQEACTETKELQLDSEAVLKSIEAQHGLLVERAKGIFSFSHLTFHEYFAANKFATISDSEKLKNALQNLASHITEKRWREIFLLTSEMLASPDYLLRCMKQQVDALLSTDEDLLRFHSWVDEKSCSVKAPYKPAAIRAFYCNVVHDLNYELAYDLASDGENEVAVAFIHTLAYDPNIDLDLDLTTSPTVLLLLPSSSTATATSTTTMPSSVLSTLTLPWTSSLFVSLVSPVTTSASLTSPATTPVTSTTHCSIRCYNSKTNFPT